MKTITIGILLHAGAINFNTPVFRRDPRDDELNDPCCLVIDTGGRYDPENGNYDHHQFDRHERSCSMLLVAQNYRLPNLPTISYHDLFSGAPWYDSTVVLDSQGPFVLARELGLQKLPEELISPVENAIISRMGETNRVPDLILMIAWQVLQKKVENGLRLRERLRDIETRSTVWEHKSGIKVIQYDRDPFGVPVYRQKKCPDVMISITKDDRGDGWALYRFDDHPRVDFGKLQGRPEVVFAHNGGFIAKTRDLLDRDGLVKLLDLSIRDE
jgi:hypothetical protein